MIIIDKWFFVLLVIFSSSLASAQTLRDQKLQDKFFPSTKQCQVSRFSLVTYDTELRDLFGSKNLERASTMAAVIETSGPSCLKDYSIVQYIRGCVYDIVFNPKTGDQTPYFGHTRVFRGEERFLFRHADWAIDTTDNNAAYGVISTGEGFVYPKTPLLLLDTKEALAHDQTILFDNTRFGSLKRSPKPLTQVFTADSPTSAEYSQGQEEMVGWNFLTLPSMQFKTCLYHLKDIPTHKDPAGFNVATDKGGPIHCFDWDNNYKFDGENKDFTRRSDIDPICL